MKRKKLVSLLITFIMLLQAIPISAAADTYQERAASESGLYQSYESFMQYANENDIPVIFDFESFKTEYETLGYESTDAYLEDLYKIIAPAEINEIFDTVTTFEKIELDWISDCEATEFDLTDLGYDEETVEAYKAYAVQAESSSVYGMCIEDFVYKYEKSGLSLEKYCDVLYEEIVEEAAAQSALAAEEASLSVENDDTVSENSEPADSQDAAVYSSSSGDSGYYYDIGTSLQVQPNYSKYKIQRTVQKGDIILDKNGSSGVAGHAAIVDGYMYSSTYGEYIRVIESIATGVCYGLLDDTRADERDSYLYRVNGTTYSQRYNAVEFCRDQLGESWFLNLTHNYDTSETRWLCSQLVWAGYKNQGIDIEGGSGIGVLPYDITVDSPMTSLIDMRGNPVGTLDLVTGENGRVRVGGWAFDYDEPSASVDIHVYIGGDVGSPNAVGYNMGPTNVYRSDVNSAHGITGTHGYDFIITTDKRGPQPVYVYAITKGPGNNTLLGQTTVNIGDTSPIGSLDGVITGEWGELTVYGWAFDYDNPTASIEIHVYVGGEAGSPNAVGFNMGPTNTLRSDVNNVYGISGNHGYSYTIDTNLRGWNPVYVYAINVGSGGNTLIGMRHVELLGAA